MKLLDHLVVVNKLHDELKKYGLNWDRDFPFICDLIEGKVFHNSSVYMIMHACYHREV